METELTDLNNYSLREVLAATAGKPAKNGAKPSASAPTEEEQLELRLSQKVSPALIHASPYVDESKVKVVCIKRSSEQARYEPKPTESRSNYVVGIPRKALSVQKVDPVRQTRRQRRASSRKSSS